MSKLIFPSSRGKHPKLMLESILRLPVSVRRPNYRARKRVSVHGFETPQRPIHLHCDMSNPSVYEYALGTSPTRTPYIPESQGAETSAHIGPFFGPWPTLRYCWIRYPNSNMKRYFVGDLVPLERSKGQFCMAKDQVCLVPFAWPIFLNPVYNRVQV